MNRELKKAIIDSGLKGYQVEQKAKLPHTKLTRIIHGVVEPTFQEKERLSIVLGKSANLLFPKALSKAA